MLLCQMTKKHDPEETELFISVTDSMAFIVGERLLLMDRTETGTDDHSLSQSSLLFSLHRRTFDLR